MRTIIAVGVVALGVSAMSATGCSRESQQQQAVKSQTDAGASTAPASAQEAGNRGQALVRVVNAVPDQPALNVTADQDTAFSNVDYKAVTPYKEVPASADHFAVKSGAEEAAAPIAENSESIMSGRHYTLVAFAEPVGELGAEKKVSLDVIADDLVPPSAGKARVRVINAAAGTDDIAVFLRGQDGTLFTDVDFKEAVAYKEVDPVRTTMELRVSEGALGTVDPKTGDRPRETPGEPLPPAPKEGAAEKADTAETDALRPGEVLATHMLNLEAGKSYTIVLAGRASGGAKPQLETLIVEDMIPATATPTN